MSVRNTARNVGNKLEHAASQGVVNGLSLAVAMAWYGVAKHVVSKLVSVAGVPDLTQYHFVSAAVTTVVAIVVVMVLNKVLSADYVLGAPQAVVVA